MDGAPVIEVVWAHPGAGATRYDVLDERERDRLAALTRAEDRDRFVAAHALARIVVGRHRGTAPAALPLAARCLRCGGPHGAPRVDDGGPPLWLSLTHAGDRVAVAVTRAGAVGIDVEVEAATAFAGFADVALSAGEREQWAAQGRPPPDPWCRARWWTRKEALLKATGHGLTVPPSALTLSPPDEPARLLAWDAAVAGAPAPAPADRVALRDLDLGAGYAGAVALIYPAGDGSAEPDVHVTVGDGLLAG